MKISLEKPVVVAVDVRLKMFELGSKSTVSLKMPVTYIFPDLSVVIAEPVSPRGPSVCIAHSNVGACPHRDIEIKQQRININFFMFFS
ncbi:MAG: hypothetical protein ACJATF_002138 [Flavobacteriales bacterium]|jgi:hypothetical protein